MQTQFIPIIILLLLFIGIMVVFSKENLDYVSYSILAAFIAIVVTLYFNPSLGENSEGINPKVYVFNLFIQFIEFDPIIFLISMQIIILICEKYKIFQWLALKTLHFAKGNHRIFFYAICIISSLSASIIADITVAIIFIPLVIRACKILKIDATPFLFAISFTINIGSLYTPFSSSENILISASFGMNFLWFLKKFTFYIFPVLLLTLFILDMIFLRKIEPPEEARKQILLEVMNPTLVIIDRKKFIMNSILLISTVIGFILYSDVWVVALVSAVVMGLLNGIPFTESTNKIDWKIIFFFISLFLMIGCMQIVGLFDIVGLWTSKILSDNPLIAAITVLLLISVLSGFLAQVPTAIVFITLLQNVYGPTVGDVPDLILMGFLFGINLGSNFLPQGAACDLMALNLAKKHGVKGFNYKTLLKNGSLITLFHIVNGIIYMTIYALITGVI